MNIILNCCCVKYTLVGGSGLRVQLLLDLSDLSRGFVLLADGVLGAYTLPLLF